MTVRAKIILGPLIVYAILMGVLYLPTLIGTGRVGDNVVELWGVSVGLCFLLWLVGSVVLFTRLLGNGGPRDAEAVGAGPYFLSGLLVLLVGSSVCFGAFAM